MKAVNVLVALRKRFTSKGISMDQFESTMDSIIGARENIVLSNSEFNKIRGDHDVTNDEILKYARMKHRVRTHPLMIKAKPAKTVSGQNVKTWLTPTPVVEGLWESDIPRVTLEVEPSPIFKTIESLKNSKFKYQEYLKSEHWQTTRRLVLERDKNHCMICRSPKSLQVHHNTYIRRGRESMDDLITLCDDCHELFSKNGKLCK